MTNLVVSADELKEYMEKFFGYGSFDSPIWFIGMEEGGACLNERVRKWHDCLKREPLVDVYEMHKDIEDIAPYYVPKNGRVKRQPTMAILIRFLLRLRGRDDDADNYARINEYQMNILGRINQKESAILDILPLPCEKISSWTHSQWTGYDSKKKYIDDIVPARAESIKKLIEKHRPLKVIFYGHSYMGHSSIVKRFPFTMPQNAPQGVSVFKEKETQYFRIPFFQYGRGLSKERWNLIANYVKAYSGK